MLMGVTNYILKGRAKEAAQPTFGNFLDGELQQT